MKVLRRQRHVTLKLIHIILIIIVVYLLAFGLANAQSSEAVTIPLSKPGQPGTLTVELVSGSITVQGYEGKEVIVRTSGADEEEDDKPRTKDGLRRITNNGFELEAIEENNSVYIKTRRPNRSSDLEIQVPRNFSVKARTVNNGTVRIENVQGEVEANNVNGSIYLTDISGSAVANTVNGKLMAIFKQVTPDTPMSFTSLNGDIDVTFPAATKMSARIKTLNGEIYTDFEMNVTPTGNRETSKSGGMYSVKLDNQISGTVNGGGPEMYFKNHNGDIFIRKK